MAFTFSGVNINGSLSVNLSPVVVSLPAYELWIWGNNGYGNLGLGDTTDRSSPVQVGNESTWTAFSDSISIKTDGTLWSWGKNFAGRLGLGDTTNRSSPVQVGSSSNWSIIKYPNYFEIPPFISLESNPIVS